MRMRIASITALLALAATPAAAAPTALPVVSLPDDQLGAPFWASIRLVEELEEPYVEEEFFIEGTATVYNYATLPAVRGDIVAIPAQTELPYKTRFVQQNSWHPVGSEPTPRRVLP